MARRSDRTTRGLRIEGGEWAQPPSCRLILCPCWWSSGQGFGTLTRCCPVAQVRIPVKDTGVGRETHGLRERPFESLNIVHMVAEVPCAEAACQP